MFERFKNKTLYCYSTTWEDDICVGVREYRKSDCFVVYKKGKLKKDENI